MRSFRADPYLWVHLAGILAVPLWLGLCLLGLAMSQPLSRVELGVIGAIGAIPILWMQWQRPFSIFSLLALSVRSDCLSDDQRRLLHWFRSAENRPLAIGTTVGTTIVLLITFWQLVHLAALASTVTSAITPIVASTALSWLPQRFLGWCLAAIGFLGANLFSQVPVSVLRVLSVSQAQFMATDPYPVDRVAQDFTLLGWPVDRILPSFLLTENSRHEKL